jgi:hypothetical protein
VWAVVSASEPLQPKKRKERKIHGLCHVRPHFSIHLPGDNTIGSTTNDSRPLGQRLVCAIILKTAVKTMKPQGQKLKY